jgi:hypothetical protein
MIQFSTTENPQIQEVNEIDRYLDSRFIGATEACWKIHGFKMNDRKPSVVPLAIHLENGQQVYFNAESTAADKDTPPRTTLTEWMKLNTTDEHARSILYPNMPQHYVWQNKAWKKRKLGKRTEEDPNNVVTDTIGRVYTVNPSQGECFYLRLLLHHVTGATSFKDLRTIDGREFDTYQEACRQAGLLIDDHYWDDCMDEAKFCKLPESLRDLFTTILIFGCPNNPLEFWERHKDSLTEDILHRHRTVWNCPTMENNIITYSKALEIIKRKLQGYGKDLSDYLLPEPDIVSNSTPREVLEELMYNTQDLKQMVETNVGTMTTDQAEIYMEVMSAVTNKQGGLFFIDAPGGTGKTFLLNTILATIRSEEEIAIAVASSGIAATLLAKGRTVHSRFKVPINILPTSTCNIGAKTGTAKLIQQSRLTVWDEAAMSHRHVLEAINRTLKDLMKTNAVMGEIVTLLAGDFRQILPVVRLASRGQIVNACI